MSWCVRRQGQTPRPPTPPPSCSPPAEGCLIKIKCSELTSHFSLHLWSICFQICSGSSNFSGLTLIWFTLPAVSNTQKQTHFQRWLSLCWERHDLSPELHFQRISVLHLFSLSLVKTYLRKYQVLYVRSLTFPENH